MTNIDVELPKYVSINKSRHGKIRYRFRKTGCEDHLFKSAPGTAEFAKEYRTALKALKSAGAGRTEERTINHLVVTFYNSTDFANGGADYQRVNRGILDAFREEWGTYPVAHFKKGHIEDIIKDKARKRIIKGRPVGGKVAAESLHKRLRRLFRLAIDLDWVENNPAERATAIKQDKDRGFYSWTEEDIAQYQKTHVLGTKARLAMEIMLWTAQRRGDCRLFGPGHITNGLIDYVQAKGSKPLKLPVAPQLRAAIDAMPAVGLKTFLVNDYGRTYASAATFGNKMREWCDAAGLPQCSSHGLRKACARRMAELDVGNQGIKAVGGWSTDELVTTYTKAADQKLRAHAALGKVIDWDLARKAAG